MTPTEMNQHMKQLIEGWVVKGMLHPLFFPEYEQCKYINGEIAFKFNDDEIGEWYSWERAVAINSLRSYWMFQAAKFLYGRGWYSQFSRKTDNAPWIHVRDIQEKYPEIDCVTNFKGALFLESMRTIDRWRSKPKPVLLVNLGNQPITLVNEKNLPRFTCSAPVTSDET